MKTSENSWVVEVKEDEEGNAVIPFDQDMIDQLGWLEGDTLDFIVDNEAGTCTVINLSLNERQDKDKVA